VWFWLACQLVKSDSIKMVLNRAMGNLFINLSRALTLKKSRIKLGGGEYRMDMKVVLPVDPAAKL
jgi:hypothetical protein